MKKFLSTFFLCCLCSLCISFKIFAQHEGLTYYVNGETLRQTGKHDAAIKEFNKALQKEPSNYKYLYSKAFSESKLRQDDAAMQTLGAAIKAKEDFVEAYVLMGEINKNSGKLNDACRYYDMAFKYEKNIDKKIDYKFFVMNKLIKTKEIPQAFEKVKEAKEAAPDNENVIYYYAKLGNILGKYEEVKNVLTPMEGKIATMKVEDASKFYYELGYAQFHLENYKGADATFKKIASPAYQSRTDKFTPKYFCSLALAYFKFHENALSKQYVDKAVKIQQGYPLAHVLLAQLSKRNNDHKSTIAHLESAVTHEKNVLKQVDLYDKIADMQLELGLYDQCIATVQKSLELKADDNEAIFTRNLVYYKKNEFQACINGVNLALKNAMDDGKKAEFNFLIGLCYKKLNDKTKAKAAFISASASSLKDAAELEITNLTE
jgi:tetratricopeptide (TPR) repeat protein